MRDDDAKGVISEARQLIEDYGKPEFSSVVDPGTGHEVPVIVRGNDVEFVDRDVFDAYRDNPVRREGTARMTKIDSLIDHVIRFRDPGSALFAVDSRKTPSITAVLDYHQPVWQMLRSFNGDDAAEPKLMPMPGALPRFGVHRSSFNFPLSDEWQAWTGFDGKPFKMAEFAAFLEDRIIDVLELIGGEDSLPEDLQRFVAICGGKVATPNKLVELSRGLQVFENAAVSEAINLGTGEAQISFSSEHVDRNGAALNVPGLFLIGIPVFKHGPIYRLAARLRYRKTPEGLMFFYEMWRADRSFDHAFSEACERVRIETDLPLFFGVPE